MDRSTARSGLGRNLVVLWTIAVALAATCAGFESSFHARIGLVVLLSGLALATELLPVEVPRRGVRITFALPLIAALAVFGNGILAVVADVFATTVVSLVMARPESRFADLRWLGANAAISISSASLGAIASGFALRGGTSVEAAVVVFIGAYALINWLLVTSVEWMLLGKSWSDSSYSMAKTAVTGFLLYSMVGLVVAVMLREQLYWAVPLILVPIWALRTGLTYQARMDETYYETITALTQMLQRAHPYTHGHLERVALSAEEVARRLGLSIGRAKLVREAAVLHDIGKIAIDESVLDKPGKLTADEWTHVKLHPTFGAEILAPVHKFSNVAHWIRHHHERPDGTGYPDALPDEKIPLESKIIAVVDAFDAMTGEEDDRRRAYRQPMTEEQALDELERCAGTQFDRAVVQAFRASVAGGPR